MQIATGPSNIHVTQSRVADTPTLESLWRDLQDRADVSMFISWSWIGNWLASLPDHVEVQVVRAEHRGRVVGLGLLVVAPLRRLGVALGKVALLHATGIPELDGVCIEHNGLLLDRSHAQDAQVAMLHYLCDERREWRALSLPGLTSGQSIPPESLPPSVQMEVRSRDCAQVLLGAVRDRGGDYLGMLSSGRRAHIRRSMRACAEWGPLSLTQASDADSASEYFDRLLQLHRARRAKLGSPSAFDTPFAQRFHRRLIESGLPLGEVQILRVRAGEHDVGYLYSFVYRGEVLYYQSGFDYGRVDHRFSPGLVTVALAIEHNARLGHRCFDFLAGDSPYKKTLSTHTEAMSWVELYRDGPLLQAENMLLATGRRGRDWLRKRSKVAAGKLGIVLTGAWAWIEISS